MRKTISPAVLDPRPMEIGKIKIGGQLPGGGRGKRPMKLDHFLVTTRVRGEDDNFERDEVIHAKVGDKPIKLKVRLIGDTPEDAFFSQMVRYEGQEWVWGCDGETARNLRTNEEGMCLRGEDRKCECKPYGRLGVLLEDAETFGAIYVFRTTSWESIRNIQTALTIFYRSFGSLAGLPLQLVMYPTTDQYRDGGQLKVGKNYKVGIVLLGTFDAARELALEHHRQIGKTRKEVRLLTAGLEVQLDQLDQVEAGEISEEFRLGAGEGENGDVPEGEEGATSKGGKKRQEPPEEAEEIDLHDLRKQYFGLLTELYEDPSEREDSRKALQFAHPELPQSSTEWEAIHFTRASGEIQKHGKSIFTKAIRELAKEDPVSEEDLDILKDLIDVSGIGHEQAGKIWRVIGCSVGAWVQREIQKLKLEGLPTESQEEDSEGAEAEQTEAELPV